MKFLFLGDIVGFAGCDKLKKNLPEIIIKKKIDFVVVNGENSFDSGVGITENIMSELLSSGVDVITTGNHVWDQKETYDFIKNEKRLLRPENSLKPVPGEGYGIFKSKNNKKVAVINLMANVFMKKSNELNPSYEAEILINGKVCQTVKFDGDALKLKAIKLELKGAEIESKNPKIEIISNVTEIVSTSV